MSASSKEYRYLEPRPGSNYREWFLKGRRIRASTVYARVHGPDHYTAEELARDFRVPIEAIYEALEYVENNMPLIEAEAKREEEKIRAAGDHRPPILDLSPDE